MSCGSSKRSKVAQELFERKQSEFLQPFIGHRRPRQLVVWVPTAEEDFISRPTGEEFRLSLSLFVPPCRTPRPIDGLLYEPWVALPPRANALGFSIWPFSGASAIEVDPFLSERAKRKTRCLEASIPPLLGFRVPLLACPAVAPNSKIELW